MQPARHIAAIQAWLGSPQYLLDNSLPPKESKSKHNTSINGFFAAIQTQLLRLHYGMEERQERQDSHTLEGLSSQVLWTQQRRFLLLMAISRMFSQEGTQLSLRGRGPDPNWQNLSTTSMYKCEKMWVDIPSSQGCGEQTAPGWRTTQGHNKSWAGGTGNGVLEQRMGFWNREWGFWNRGHLEGGKRCDLGEQGQTMRGEKLHLFRRKIKVKRKGRSKTVMINSMGGGHNQLLFPGHKCCLPGDADIGQNTNILLQGQWEQHEKSRNSSM